MSGQSKTPPCPICTKPTPPKALNRFAPFCSRRCADLDLGKWLKGGYAIPGPEAESSSENPLPSPANDHFADPGQPPEEE